MKKILLLLAAIPLLLVPLAAYGGNVNNVMGKETISLKDTSTVHKLLWSSTTCSAQQWEDLSYVVMSFEGSDVHWWSVSGVTPTNIDGMLLQEGDYIHLDTKSGITNFKVIQDHAGSGSTVYIQYYGPLRKHD